MTLKAIDLFSGGGALSEGLKKSGFCVIGAVENDLNIIPTYKANQEKTHVFDYDIRHVSAKEILTKCNIKRGELDLLSGCPPCQGFSTLTKQYNANDERNSLIKEVARLVEGLLPKTIMIENVPGLISRGNNYLNAFLETLETLGYTYCYDVLQVADYGVPQMRKRFVLLASISGKIRIPEPTHNSKGNGKPKWVNVKKAFKGMKKPITLSDAIKGGGATKYNWNVIRNLTYINIERLKHLYSGGNRFSIPDELRPNCHKGNNTGFSNVYGRMSWEKPSPTITGGCTTLSKGRFGHPTELRTISVREAARLQTFPDNYIFNTEAMDNVCKIIGNALPVTFAHKISKACVDVLT